MSFFGFGDNIITWIKILNTDFKASILQSGFLSEQILISRGCRQGDPVAPYLFLFCAEILSILVKENKDITGIKINNSEHKITQYADDTTLILDGSEKSLFAALNTLDYFSSISGLHVNSSKTKIVWIGSKKFSREVYHHVRWNLVWGETKFQLLGIFFSVNLQEMVDLNFDPQKTKMSAVIKHWSRRILTPIGRVSVTKSLILPKLNHLFIALPNPPKQFISEINNVLFHFIWKAKCDKVKRDIVTQEKSFGGLSMTNISNHINVMKCTWIKRIFKGGQLWMNLFETTFGKDVNYKLFDFGDDYIETLINCINNNFWVDVFNSWKVYIKYQINSVKSSTELVLLPIWYNSEITINRKSFFKLSWYSKGVKLIIDFLDSRGNILSKTEFENKFDIKVDTLFYNSVKSSILAYFRKHDFKKDTFENPSFPCLPTHLKNIIPKDKCTKYIYNILNKKQNLKPTSFLKWEQEVAFLNEIPIYNEAFKTCFFVTNDTAIQWFQFRLLHRILPVNRYLRNIGIKVSDACWFCDEKEDIIHTFVTCPSIYGIWPKLSLHIYNKTKQRIGFNTMNIIFGELHSKTHIPINFIILYTKFFIFKCSRQEKTVHLDPLLKFIHFNFKIQKYIAVSNKTEQTFGKTWSGWESIFNL